MTEALGNCSRCGRQWNALSQAHCPTCCAHFSSDSAFDLHLGPIPASGRPKCKDPAKVAKRDGTPKLVLRDGVWGLPGSRPQWAARGAGAAVAARAEGDR